MSEDHWFVTPEARFEAMVREIRLLTPDDQQLVMTLVNRLRGPQDQEFPPDVPFMDFDE